VNWLGEFYQKIWFAVEFNLTPVDRRPFTFIMRDYIFQYPKRAVPMIVAWYVGMAFLLCVAQWVAWGFTIASTAVLFHVIWGTPWIEHQQEFPEYLGD